MALMVVAPLLAIALISCGTEGVASATAEGTQRPAPVGPPNILFLFADDQRRDTVAALGNPHIETPNVDALARRGFCFERNYCFGSIHGAVCQPSRAMVLSGRSLWHVPMNLEGVQTLPEVLAGRGYTTFISGKWHNGQESCLRSFDVGKAIMFGGMSDHTKVPVRDIGPDGKATEKRTGEKFSSELFADAVIEFIDGHDGDKPFFAYVPFTAPHDPRQPPLRWREHYYRERPPLPANYMPQHPFHNGWMTGRDEKLAAWPRTREVIADQVAEYYGMISHLDEQVGRIVEALERGGHTDNTIIVYTADHGLAVGSHGLLGKQSVYEHSMGCPLIVAGPGVPKGSTRALTYLFDLFPTLCEMAGAKLPEGVEGKSLVPVMRDEVAGVRDTLFLAYENKMRAVRDDRYKLIRYPLIDHVQLFDVEADPDELRDLAQAPAERRRVAHMMAQMEGWQRRTDDPHPLHVETPKAMEIDLSGRERKPDPWQPRWIVEKYFGK